MDADTLTQTITDTKAILAALSAAILALADPTVESYTLDTGQTVERVLRVDLPRLITTRQSLQNELCTLQARQTGSGALLSVPRW